MHRKTTENGFAFNTNTPNLVFPVFLALTPLTPFVLWNNIVCHATLSVSLLPECARISAGESYPRDVAKARRERKWKGCKQTAVTGLLYSVLLTILQSLISLSLSLHSLQASS